MYISSINTEHVRLPTTLFLEVSILISSSSFQLKHVFVYRYSFSTSLQKRGFPTTNIRVLTTSAFIQ